MGNSRCRIVKFGWFSRSDESRWASHSSNFPGQSRICCSRRLGQSRLVSCSHDCHLARASPQGAPFNARHGNRTWRDVPVEARTGGVGLDQFNRSGGFVPSQLTVGSPSPGYWRARDAKHSSLYLLLDTAWGPGASGLFATAKSPARIVSRFDLFRTHSRRGPQIAPGSPRRAHC